MIKKILQLLLIPTLFKSLVKIKQDKITYLFMFFQLIIFSRNVRQLGTDNFLLINLILVIMLCLSKKKNILDVGFIYITSVYFFIYLIHYFQFSVEIIPTIGFYIRLLTAYYLIKYFEYNLYIYFENLVFLLAYLSIPLFILQITIPSIFDIFIPFTNGTLAEECVVFGNFRYMIVFLINNWHEGISFRNSGFMSEPSAFASIITWTIMINLGFNDFKSNSKLIILLIALITTFSRGGLIYFGIIIFVIFLASVNNKKVFYRFMGLVIVLFALIFILKDTDFIANNLSDTMRKNKLETVNIQRLEAGKLDMNSVSRISGAKANLDYFLFNPLGYGFSNKVQRYGGASPNGFFVLLYRFGIWFLLLVTISSCRFVNQVTKGINVSIYVKFVYAFLLIVPSAGYSFTNQSFLWVLFLGPLFIKNIYNQKYYYLYEY